MENTLQIWRKIMMTFLLTTAMVVIGFSQTNLPTNGVEPGKVHVKFERAMASTLSSMSVRTENGRVVTGISAFDKITAKYGAVELKPMFIAKPGREQAHIRHGLHLWYEVVMNLNADIPSSLNELSALAEISLAEPIYKKALIGSNEFTRVEFDQTTVNDPGFKDQWHYLNDGSEGGVLGMDINLSEAWDMTMGSNEIIVAVHDTGIDPKHEDLKDNMWVNEAELNGEPGVDDDFNGYIDDIHGYDFIDFTGDVSVDDHGTHVGGTISAVNNNGVGVAGVAGGSGMGDGVKLMNLRTIGGTGNMAASYVYAADNGAIISQNSWGYLSSGYYEQVVLDAIDYFVAEAGYWNGSPMKGGIVIFAAGNNGQDQEHYPSYYESVLSVASINRAGIKAGYSNFGGWVDISAPGGEMTSQYGGAKGGIMSTLPGNGYGYNNGTSMACPHVSGIAALVIANNGGTDFTNEDLWTYLITGVNSIDEYNPDLEGKMGSGLIDAALAVKRDEGIAPDRITDFSVNAVSQDFADFKWTSVGDTDDGTVFGYEISFSTDSVDVVQGNGVTTRVMINKDAAGTPLSYTVEDLIAETKYYFGISAFDRYGNKGTVSEVVTVTTTAAPEIAFDVVGETAITINQSTMFSSSNVFNVINNAEGALKWNSRIRQTRSYSLANSGANYPEVSTLGTEYNVGGEMTGSDSEQPSTGTSDYDNDFSQREWKYGPDLSGLTMIGDEDIKIPNSAATRFVVSDPQGFNLTRIHQLMRLNRNTHPNGVLEIYAGETMERKNLVLVQNFDGNSSDSEQTEVIYLDHQLYFEQGEVFWVVLHMPSQILYPLAVGRESNEDESDNSFYSNDMGKTWVLLEDVYGNGNHVWRTILKETTYPLHEYMTVTPTDGVTPGLSQQEITVDVDGSKLINGTYYASAVFYSNDDDNRVADVDFKVTVSGHQPEMSAAELVNVGSTFVGVPITIDIPLINNGYGVYNINKNNSGISNPDFAITTWPISSWSPKVKALDGENITVTFTPSTAGTISGQMTLVDNNGNQVVIHLSGAALDPSEISLPIDSSQFTMNIGEVQSGNFTIQNTGNYPLQYYLPRYEDKENITVVPYNGSGYGYSWATSNDVGTDVTYEFEDITATGTDITEFWMDPTNRFYEVDLGFEFPYYKHWFNKLYLTKYGVITTHDQIGVVGNSITPGSEHQNVQISGLNRHIQFDNYGGQMLFQRKSGKFIMQVNNAGISSWAKGTFQIVLYDNGDIKFNYSAIDSYVARGVTIAATDPDKKFGFVAYDGSTSTPIPSANVVPNTSILIKSPGVDAIENLSKTSGTIPVGGEEIISFDVNASSLVEGNWYNRLMVASNDPVSPLTAFTSLIDIVGGGVPVIEMSTAAIDMGTIFQTDSVGRVIEMKNTGTKSVDINNISLANGNFVVTNNEFPYTLKPRSTYYIYVGHNGSTLGDFTDVLTIDNSDGSTFDINLAISVIEAPDIEVTTDPIAYDLNIGEKTTHSLTVTNNGGNPLEYSIGGMEWIYPSDGEVAQPLSNLPDETYIWTSNTLGTGTSYNWEELVDNGEQLDNGDITEYHTKKLPFKFRFYGVEYDTIYINSNGFITFNDELIDLGQFDLQSTIPDTSLVDNVIAPYWGRGAYYNQIGDQDDHLVGVFYKEYEDYVIVEFSKYWNVFGMGNPFSFQAILYKNGNIKFQYNYLGLPGVNAEIGIVGLENQDGTEGVLVAPFGSKLIQDKMAVILTPAKKRTIQPGQSEQIDMVVDATKIYGGSYSGDILFQSNVPTKPNTLIPAALNITGFPEYNMPDSLDFGLVVAEKLPNGNPVPMYLPFDFSNVGTDAMDISTIDFAVGTEFSLEEFTVFCRFWCIEVWDAPSLPWNLLPDESKELRIVLSPQIMNYTARDTIIFNAGMATELRVPIVANVFLPPVMSVDISETHFEALNKDFEGSGMIEVNNKSGQSDLDFTIELSYQRAIATTASMAHEINNSPERFEGGEISKVDAINTSTGTNSVEAYNREIFYGDQSPETYVGFGESAAFTSATKFVADKTGFNLTHASTYYYGENTTNSRIVVEVYSGESIYDAVLQTSSEYTFTHEINYLDWVTIPLDEPFTAAPFETFWLVYRYQVGVAHPQGINLAPDNAGVFLYPSEGQWHDIQDLSSFSSNGWLVKAQEEVFASSSWIELAAYEGTVPSGDSLDIGFDVYSRNLDEGFVSANLKVLSNDPYRPDTLLNVTLRMNLAPEFFASSAEYEVNELETLTFDVSATDLEGDEFTYELVGAPSGMVLSQNGSTASVTYTPYYNASGTYTFTVEATDANGNSNIMDVSVIVLDTYILGMEDLNGKLFKAYPNPVDGILNLEIPEEGNYQVRVINSAGQVLIQRLISATVGANTLDVSRLSRGLYIVELKGEAGVEKQRIVKN